MQFATSLRASALACGGMMCVLALGAQAQVAPGIESRGAADSIEPAVGDVGPNVRAAEDQVQAAREVLERMTRDTQLAALLARSKGVFIVLDASRSGTVVGERNGEGLLFVNNGSEWRGPAFFNFEQVSVGSVGEAAEGAIAMILMSASAVSRFTVPETAFTLDGSVGKFVSYANERAADVDLVDFVTWSHTAPVDEIVVHSIARDADDNMAFYDEPVTPQEIFSGVVSSDRGAQVRALLPTPDASY